MAVIDLETGRTLKTLPSAIRPGALMPPATALHDRPQQRRRAVSVISTETLTEVARLPGAADMTGVNTGSFDSLAYVISRGDDKALIIDLETMQPAGEIALPGTPETGVVTPDGTKLYVALSDANTVAVIDVAAKAVIATIDGVGEEPWGAHMAGAVNYCH